MTILDSAGSTDLAAARGFLPHAGLPPLEHADETNRSPQRLGQPQLAAARRRPRTGMPRVLAMLAIGLLALAAAGFPATAQSPPQQDGTVRGQHGDWQTVCKPPPPGAKNEICALVQSVTAEDRNNVGLTVYFQKFTNGTRVLRVFTPLGILLPPGLGLKIDGADIGNAPFLRCHTFACYAQVVVDDPLITKLSRGKTAIFIIFQTEEAGIGIPISLAGFADGLAQLR